MEVEVVRAANQFAVRQLLGVMEPRFNVSFQ
jgi:hypothetical protein